MITLHSVLAVFPKQTHFLRREIFFMDEHISQRARTLTNSQNDEIRTKVADLVRDVFVPTNL